MNIEERVWQTYTKDLSNFVVSITKNKDTAEDIVQDTLIAAFEKRADLKETTKLKSWLFSIARNKTIDYFRKAGRFTELDLQALEEGLEEYAEAESIMPSCLRHLAHSLPEIYSVALVGSDLADVKQADAAKKLGISLPAFKSRILRGRQMLKEKLFQCCPLKFENGVPTACVGACKNDQP